MQNAQVDKEEHDNWYITTNVLYVVSCACRFQQFFRVAVNSVNSLLGYDCNVMIDNDIYILLFLVLCFSFGLCCCHSFEWNGISVSFFFSFFFLLFSPHNIGFVALFVHSRIFFKVNFPLQKLHVCVHVIIMVYSGNKHVTPPLSLAFFCLELNVYVVIDVTLLEFFDL